MRTAQRILWGEGTFLRPQHFQQQDLHLDGRLARILGTVHAHPWGLRALEVDRDALEAGVLNLTRFSACFQDGTFVDAPDPDLLPPARSLEALEASEGALQAWAALPLLDPSGGNGGEGGHHGGRPTRWITGAERVRDLVTEAPEADLAVLRPHLRLLLDGEPADGTLALPVLRLRRAPSGAWALDGTWIPPLLELGGSDRLMALAGGLATALQARAATLAAARGERTRNLADLGAAESASFWMLHALGQAVPGLRHLLACPSSHPERLYGALASLAGGLLAFSSRRGLQDVPPYRHQDLGGTFRGLDALVRDLLETVLSTRHALVPLSSPRPGFHLGRLEGAHLEPGTAFFLSVTGDHPAARILEEVPLKLKVGGPDDVERIVNSALPGVRLEHVTQAPAALPVRVGNHYFALDPHGPIYDRMVQAGTVCIYAPTALSVRLDLLAVLG